MQWYIGTLYYISLLRHLTFLNGLHLVSLICGRADFRQEIEFIVMSYSKVCLRILITTTLM